MSATKKIIRAREEIHGSYRRVAPIAQATLRMWQSGPNWDILDDVQREALHMIATKISRIMCGDANHKDHWMDISGYAVLAADNLDPELQS